jgi:hypothetical protein
MLICSSWSRIVLKALSGANRATVHVELLLDDLGYVILVSHPLRKTIAGHLYLSESPLVDATPGTGSESFQSL